MLMGGFILMTFWAVVFTVSLLCSVNRVIDIAKYKTFESPAIRKDVQTKGSFVTDQHVNKDVV